MPVVPTPPTIYDAVTASSTFNQFRDAIRFLQDPPLAYLRQTVAQSLTSGAFVAVNFDAEDFDSDVDNVGGHSTSVDTSRFTARYAGWYQLGGGPGFSANATGVRLSYWAVNTAVVNGSEVLVPTTSGFSHCHGSRVIPVYLDINDFVELYVFQNSGGALNTSVTAQEQSSAYIKWMHR